MRKTIALIMVGAIAGVAWSPSEASVVSGNFYTEFYSYRVKLPEDETQIRSLQGLRLNVKDALIPGLSFYARGRLASDISNKLTDDPNLRVYGAYLQYIFSNKNASVRAGRQFVYEGLSSLTLDGIRLKLSFKRWFSIAGFVGTTPGPSFFSYDEINEWKDSNAWGGRLQIGAISNLKLNFSYLEKGFQDNLDSRLAGFDARFQRDRFSTELRLDYDMLFERTKLFSIRPRYKLIAGHSVRLEYTYRKPSFGQSNIFSVFKSRPYHQVRLNPAYRISPAVYALGSISYTKYNDDNQLNIRLGTSYKGQSAGVVFADGYGGARLGVYGFINRQMNSHTVLYARADMYTYKLDSDQESSNSSISTTLGGKYEIFAGLDAKAEMQILSNIQYEYDTRFYIKVAYSFISEEHSGDKESGAAR
ncbi:MAG: hypothetical protein V3S06_00855 [candidate division Zixibacteria bacterium]